MFVYNEFRRISNGSKTCLQKQIFEPVIVYRGAVVINDKDFLQNFMFIYFYRNTFCKSIC